MCMVDENTFRDQTVSAECTLRSSYQVHFWHQLLVCVSDTLFTADRACSDCLRRHALGLLRPGRVCMEAD